VPPACSLTATSLALGRAAAALAFVPAADAAVLRDRGAVLLTAPPRAPATRSPPA
jgi:hypothetical protein